MNLDIKGVAINRLYDAAIGFVGRCCSYFAAPWNEIGNDYYELNQYDKALKAYEKAIELRPGVGLYWANKGDALDELGFIAEADMAYDRAEELGYEVW